MRVEKEVESHIMRFHSYMKLTKTKEPNSDLITSYFMRANITNTFGVYYYRKDVYWVYKHWYLPVCEYYGVDTQEREKFVDTINQYLLDTNLESLKANHLYRFERMKNRTKGIG